MVRPYAKASMPKTLTIAQKRGHRMLKRRTINSQEIKVATSKSPLFYGISNLKMHQLIYNSLQSRYHHPNKKIRRRRRHGIIRENNNRHLIVQVQLPIVFISLRLTLMTYTAPKTTYIKYHKMGLTQTQRGSITLILYFKAI